MAEEAYAGLSEHYDNVKLGKDYSSILFLQLVLKN